MKTGSLLTGVVSIAGCLICAAALGQELRQPASIMQMISNGDGYASMQADPRPAIDPAAGRVQPVGYLDTEGGMMAQETYRWSPSATGMGRQGKRGFELGGWIDQGVTFGTDSPADRFNGVVGMNDRRNEYQMNQLWFYLERETAVRGDGWDIGGRVDVMYGTDAYFLQCKDGLEESWNQTERFYQMALPQFYLDVAYNDFTFTMGHFISPLEWESYLAPHNFFYSHSYGFMYGVPGTMTGGMLTWDFSDQAQVFAGFHRGGDQFNDTDGLNALNFMCGFSWESEDEDTYVEFALDAEEDGDSEDSRVTMGTISMLRKLTCKTDYMIEYLQGRREVCGNNWYGINQHLIHKLNCKWSVGGRFEWFRDNDGQVVYGYRPTNTAHGPFVGDFYEITLGVNCQMRKNLVLRNELRYDWYTAFHGGGPLPFDSGEKNDQFLYAIDLIYTF